MGHSEYDPATESDVLRTQAGCLARSARSNLSFVVPVAEEYSFATHDQTERLQKGSARSEINVAYATPGTKLHQRWIEAHRKSQAPSTPAPAARRQSPMAKQAFSAQRRGCYALLTARRIASLVHHWRCGGANNLTRPDMKQ